MWNMCCKRRKDPTPVAETADEAKGKILFNNGEACDLDLKENHKRKENVPTDSATKKDGTCIAKPPSNQLVNGATKRKPRTDVAANQPRPTRGGRHSSSSDSSTEDDSEDTEPEKYGNHGNGRKVVNITNITGSHGQVNIGNHGQINNYHITTTKSKKKRKEKQRQKYSPKTVPTQDVGDTRERERYVSAYGKEDQVTDDTNPRTGNFVHPGKVPCRPVFQEEVKVRVAKSVGFIKGFGVTGTGFRVGPNYIMTAWHVVKNILVAGKSKQPMVLTNPKVITNSLCPIKLRQAGHFAPQSSCVIVVAREVRACRVGDQITMTLMKKDKGSIYAVPAHLWQKQAADCHNVHDIDEITRHVKVLTATSKQVLEDVIHVEKSQLRSQLLEAEQSEEAFISGALTQLAAREAQFTGVGRVEKEVAAIQEAVRSAANCDTVEPPAPAVPHYTNTTTKKVKQYKSAFSDEEDSVTEADTEVEALTTRGSPPGDDGHHSSDTMDVSPNKSPVATMSSPDGMVSTHAPTEAVLPPPMETAGPEPPVEMDVPAPPGDVVPEMMPVEEAAQHLELPAAHKSWKMSAEDSFYFYQAADGQHVYMHSVNARCLVREYGSLENSPATITATILEKEAIFVTEELRHRLRYLSHLPLTCGFEVAELSLRSPLVGKDTLKHFADELEKRQRLRQRRSRDDKRRAHRIEEQERRRLGIVNTGVIIQSQFNQPQPETSTIVPSQFSPGRWSVAPAPAPTTHRLAVEHDRRSDTSSPSLDTPIGSPPDSAEIKSGTSPTKSDDGSQTATLSFAQMLKAGKRSTTWPSHHKGEEPLSPGSTSSQRASDDSDNEDKVRVPRYQSSFGTAIQDAFQSIDATRTEVDARPTPSSGKKKKKQLVLFSTSMARGGK